MPPIEAARLLGLPAEATPEQIEARFLELRARLEEKIAKAPTPGLQAKYREGLAATTAAYEAMALAADGSDLPVARRPVAGGVDAGPKIQSPAPGSPPPATAAGSKPKKFKSTFVIGAVVAIAALAASGWLVLKTRAEAAEKTRLEVAARLEAEQKALADKAESARQAEAARVAAETARRDEDVRQAAAAEQARLAAEEKARQEKYDQQAAVIRTALVELKMAWEATEQQARVAERRAADLRAEVRHTDATTGEGRRRQALQAMQQEFSDWLNGQLPRHPARVARAQAEELLSSRQLDEAAAAVQKALAAQKKFDEEIAAAPGRLETQLYGTLLLELERPDDTWAVVDAFGRLREGRGSARLEKMAVGTGTLTLSRADWPPLTESFSVTAGPETSHAIRWRGANVTIVANAPGAVVYEQGRELGAAPLTIKERPPGALVLEVRAPKHRPAQVSATLQANQTLQLDATLPPFTASDALAEFMKPHRGRWKLAAYGFGSIRTARYDDYVIVSEDGQTLTHHATNGPRRGTHPMAVILLDEKAGLVAADSGFSDGEYQLYRFKDDHVDLIRGNGRKRNGQWEVFLPNRLTNYWVPLEQLPGGIEALTAYWIYRRAE